MVAQGAGRVGTPQCPQTCTGLALPWRGPGWGGTEQVWLLAELH